MYDALLSPPLLPCAPSLLSPFCVYPYFMEARAVPLTGVVDGIVGCVGRVPVCCLCLVLSCDVGLGVMQHDK